MDFLEFRWDSRVTTGQKLTLKNEICKVGSREISEEAVVII